MTGKLSEEEWSEFMVLVMADVDGEISSEDKVRLNRLLYLDADCREEWEQFKRLKEVTSVMKMPNPGDEVWESYWFRVYNRIERGLGWMLFTLGAAIVVAYGLIELVQALWADTDMPALMKAGVFALVVGLVVLLISVIREKLYLQREERYKEVVR